MYVCILISIYIYIYVYIYIYIYIYICMSIQYDIFLCIIENTNAKVFFPPPFFSIFFYFFSLILSFKSLFLAHSLIFLSFILTYFLPKNYIYIQASVIEQYIFNHRKDMREREREKEKEIRAKSLIRARERD